MSTSMKFPAATEPQTAVSIATITPIGLFNLRNTPKRPRISIGSRQYPRILMILKRGTNYD